MSIDPGERGDFYLLQLPLQGHAWMQSGPHEAWLSPDVLGVLQPRAPTRMHWSADCTMLLLQVPQQALQQRLITPQSTEPSTTVRLTLPRSDPAVAAWWQTVLDMTRNLHHHGAQWMRQPATWQAMESFLLTGLQLLCEPAENKQDGLPAQRQRHRCLDRALEYIHSHAQEGLTLAQIAAAACVSSRTLETAFRHAYDQSPLGYARGVQLDMAHHSLATGLARQQGLRITDVALQHGFSHMGRFATYYKQRFGCTPSQTLQGH